MNKTGWYEAVELVIIYKLFLPERRKNNGISLAIENEIDGFWMKSCVQGFEVKSHGMLNTPLSKYNVYLGSSFSCRHILLEITDKYLTFNFLFVFSYWRTICRKCGWRLFKNRPKSLLISFKYTFVFDVNCTREVYTLIPDVTYS